ncbi:HupE/UreJ family protein [Methylomonas sp. UP202]|uniref:HupE/UreJ family protein n=1 Tax=Methylomonas sp. UP202 TaxID=3040943 RepID=UPI00247ABEE3|nr:HupE/UreJ family protein [Methylomonas sp. UP202]WGS85090.1 HupE/UreJ family protein [Methylomonas sp. UP202]
MQSTFFDKQTEVGLRPNRMWLSVGLPLLLLVAFLGNQFVDFDSIGLSNGFSHPLTGWDHLITMLAVGVWAAQMRGHAIWMLPLSFVGVMSLGGLVGSAGIDIPSIEGIILLSCAVFIVLISRKIRFSGKINVMIVAFFGFFHGFAHGQEISTSASLISYTVGFMVATLLLHGAGILVAKLVMLAITCLITLLFSSAALANAVQSRIELDDKNTTSTLKVEFSSTSNPHELWRGVLEKSGNQSIVRSESVTTTISSVAPDHNQQAHRDSVGSYAMYQLSKSSSINKLDRASLVELKPDESPTLALDFKHYYPDINQSPGKQLLSNGVGLTSPPACQYLTASNPVSPPRFKRLVLSSEEPLLHLVFAENKIGYLAPQFNICRLLDCALRSATTQNTAALNADIQSYSLYLHNPIHTLKILWPSLGQGLVTNKYNKNQREIAS